MIRVDMAERMAATPMRRGAGKPRAGRSRRWSPRSACSPETVAKLMRDIGFRPDGEAAQAWVWRGRERRRQAAPRRPPAAAFAALARAEAWLTASGSTNSSGSPGS